MAKEEHKSMAALLDEMIMKRARKVDYIKNSHLENPIFLNSINVNGV
jgi:hypothetical protein